jgi:hypothetical protein
MNNLTSKQKGISTEIQCLSAFAEKVFTVSIPYGDGARYDFIVEINNCLWKIQCKTASFKEEGVYTIECRSGHSNCNGYIHKNYTENEIDFFCTMINKQCYLIPVQEASTSKTLRFIPPKNNNKVTLAFEYELDKQIEKMKG